MSDRRMFQDVLTADLRSLACMRVLIGGGMVCDVIDRARDLTAHYSDGGVLSTETARALVAHFGWFSLHTLSGSFAYQLVLVVASLLVGVSVMVGFATRLMTPLAWVLCVSVQNRFCLGDYPGDYLLAVVLLTGSFLPWGAWFSVDAWRRRRWGAAALPARYRGVSARALLVLFCLFMAAAGLSKISAGGSWTDGTALFLTLSAERYTSGWLDRLLDHPALLEPISYAVPWIELALPVFLVFPWRNGAVRTVTIGLGCVLFTSFSVGLDVGPFPFLAASVAIGVLPPWFWERLLPRLPRRLANRSSTRDGEATDLAWLGTRVAVRSNNALAICFLLLHVTHYCYKIGNYGYFSSPHSPPALVGRAMSFFRIKNIYRLFADPTVFEQSDGWDVAPGELASGRKVNAFTGEDLSFDQPRDATESVGGLRWHQYLTLVNWYPTWDPKNISRYAVVDYATMRADLARFLCRRWNTEHGGADRLVSVNVAMVIAPVRYAQPKLARRVVELLEPAYRCESSLPGAGATAHAH